ncbi:MAG: SMC family ATPase [Candidatus Micrarchaeales archaeon]|nr:SMC family ATPase [Candidatus Micrarchaeales archaeon]
MIDAIEITNWKTHKKTKLEFQKGVNVLIGVMGAGKSSAMDAICFGLFGTFPALLSKRVSLEELIMSRPSQETEAEVKLSFSVGDDQYAVTRTIGKKGNSAKLERNGEYIQSQPTKVTEEIESILKIDYDTFSRVIYSEQNQLDYFLGLAKGPRKKELDHMLGLDTFALAEENATSLINRVKDIIKVEEESLARVDEKELKAELETIKVKREGLQKEQEHLHSEEKSAREVLEKMKVHLESIRKDLERKRKISEEIGLLMGKSTTIAREVKKLDEMKIDAKAIAARKAELESRESELKTKIEEKRKTVTLLTRRVATLEESVKSSKEKQAKRDKIIAETKGHNLKSIKEKVEAENRAWKALTDEAAAKQSRAEEINEWLKELNKHISKCPLCERTLDDDLRMKLITEKSSLSESLLKEIREAVKNSEEKYRHIKQLNELQDKITAAEGKLQDYKDVDKLLEKEKAEYDKAMEELGSENIELEKLSKEYDALREPLSRIRADLQSVEKKKEFESELMKAKEVLEKKSDELRSISADDNMLYSTQEKMTKQSAAHSDLSARLKSNLQMLAQMESQEKDKEKQVKSIDIAAKKIAARQKQVQNLNKFKGALVETGAMLRNKLVTSINNLMQGLWPQLYPYGDYASIRLDAKRDDYLLEVNAGRNGTDDWIQVDGIASGGERSIGCLAMRIALAMVTVPNLRWLILDEPTHNIDSAGISKMIEILGEELPSIVDQIFIITHEDALKQISLAKVYTLERDKAANAPTSIAQS